jgi:putative membrane protein
MKPFLSQEDRDHLENRVAEAEKLTNSQIVLATVRRSDSYAEIPWKAFTMCAALAGLLVFVLNLIISIWLHDIIVLISIMATLATGALGVLLTIVFPWFARLFLSGNRAEAEVRQYAESMFLSRELFSTSHRTGILLLISRFERKVVILPDKGLSDNVAGKDLDKVIALMKEPLSRNDIRGAMDLALDEFIRIIRPLSSSLGAGDELSNRIIEEKGV